MACQQFAAVPLRRTIRPSGQEIRPHQNTGYRQPALFVDDSLGTFPGTLPLSAINLYGAAVTPGPAIAVNFRSFDSGCGEPLRCTVEIADTGLQPGVG